MEELNQIGSKIEELKTSRQSVEGKTKELEDELTEKLKAFEEKYEEKRLQLEEEYKSNKEKLKAENDTKKNEVLKDINNLEAEIITLTDEAYKKAIFSEFDRKRSVDVYDPKDAKSLVTLKKFIEENPNLPQKYLEKIEALYAKKKTIDELMYEYT